MSGARSPKHSRSRTLCVLAAWGWLACGGGVPEAASGPAYSLPERDESQLAEPERRAGFVDVAAASHVWLGRRQTSGAARLFYNFVPADEGAKHRPVFVLFNGGPGASSMYLHALGTGPQTLSSDDWSAPPRPNPHSLSRLGNLLYVDARLTGFSYAVAADPEDEDERQLAWSAASLNPGVDAADFVRVVLRTLEAQPALRDNPVVLVGESYGGQRAALMLDLLLAPDRLPEREPLYSDAELAAEMDRHYRAVFGRRTSDLSPDEKAAQFGWQVLIQPGVARPWQALLQFGSEAERRGALLDDPDFVGECSYHGARTAEWCRELDEAIVDRMTSLSGFEAIVGRPAAEVPGLAASQRSGAFRCSAPECPLGGDPVTTPDPSWIAELGALPQRDHYFSLFVGGRASELDDDPPYLPFAEVVPHVHTLITNARWDLGLDSELIVPALRQYAEQRGSAETGIESVRYVGAGGPDQVSEAIELRFGETATRAARSRVVRFPAYANSGHVVSATEAGELHRDVSSWLDEAPSMP